jgi:hypothetical protein
MMMSTGRTARVFIQLIGVCRSTKRPGTALGLEKKLYILLVVEVDCVASRKQTLVSVEMFFSILIDDALYGEISQL